MYNKYAAKLKYVKYFLKIVYYLHDGAGSGNKTISAQMHILYNEI